jgi:hypothetical protein
MSKKGVEDIGITVTPSSNPASIGIFNPINSVFWRRHTVQEVCLLQRGKFDTPKVNKMM